MKHENQKLERAMGWILVITTIMTALLVILTIVIGVVWGQKNGDSNKTLQNQEDAKTTTKAKLSADGPSEEYYYKISYEEKVMLAKLVFAESGFEPFEGKVAIAAVVLNRYYSKIPYFHKDSIEAVITQPYQFASIENVTMEILQKNPECMEAVEAACKGWDPTRAKFPEGALYFYAPALMPKDFQKGVEVLKIGKVNFHYDYKLYEN